MRTKITLAALAVIALLAAASSAPRSDESVPRIDGGNVFTFYKSFERVTKYPRTVVPSIAMLCITPTAAALERIKEANKEATGPHNETHVHYYVNAVAARRSSKTEAFAPGATVIKEKLDDPISAIGGMRKREPGFDSANGDWEYFYASRRGGFSIGRLANCIACHQRAKETDYVYGRWPSSKKDGRAAP